MLGQILHPIPLSYDTPKDAIPNMLGLEVEFFHWPAILHVQNSVSRGDCAYKKEAWQETFPCLRNILRGTMRSIKFIQEIGRSLTRKKKEYTTIRALQNAMTKSST